MTPLLALAMWLTIVGATWMGGLIAHDGIPVKEWGNIIVPIVFLIIGLGLGIIGISK